MDDDLYREELLDHYYSSPHRGHLEAPDFGFELENALCGDRIKIEMQLDARQTISRVRFNGDGCVISQAAASLLAERMEGATLQEALRFSADEMLELIKARLTPARRKCGLLAWRALQRALPKDAEV